ncbi:MAG TPA: M48 family metalloprotease [Steroidobacteraceae bacterium]
MRMPRAIWFCRILVTLVACGLTIDAIAASDNAAVASQLPDMGSPENAALSKADEFQVGRMIIREMRDQNLLLDDPEIADYVQNLGARLGAQTNRDEQNYQYFVIKDPEVNAFALYGGFVCVHSGLIMLTEDESQLASVLAHETAHVRQRHLARAYQAESKMSLASTAALLAAVLIGALAGANGGAMEGMIAMSQGVALQQAMNFTRAEEAEADRVGIGLLANAGFRTSAMADFFESMARGEGISEASSLDMLRNHPVTRDRIAEARERAAQVEQQPVEESGLFPWMKERLRVVIAPPEINATVYYTKLAEQRALTDPERYGQALAQLRAENPAPAVQTLRELVAAHPDITTLYASLGQAELAAHEQTTALATFSRAMRLFPRNVPITVRYAEALMKVDQPKPAHTLLLDLFNNVEPTPYQIRLTALAASAAGDTGDAYYYMAEYHVTGGDLPLANQQLELALASPDLTTVQRQRFRARLEQIRDWLREQQRDQRRRTGGI